MPLILKAYKKFEDTGQIDNTIIKNQNPYEVLTCPLQFFIVKPDEIDWSRLDAFYYSPELKITPAQRAKINESDLWKDLLVKSLNN